MSDTQADTTEQLKVLEPVVKWIDPDRELVYSGHGYIQPLFTQGGVKVMGQVQEKTALDIRLGQARRWLYQHAVTIEDGFNGKSGVITTFTVHREWRNCDGYIEGDGPKGTLVHTDTGYEWRMYRRIHGGMDEIDREQYPHVPFLAEGEYTSVFDSLAHAYAATITELEKT